VIKFFKKLFGGESDKQYFLDTVNEVHLEMCKVQVELARNTEALNCKINSLEHQIKENEKTIEFFKIECLEKIEVHKVDIERMDGLNKLQHESTDIRISFVEASNQAHNEGFEKRIKSLEERIEKFGG
tara:strand:+ start:169 stop:552 length:384 start_codon:yes stop_codon:yes gene_type:complete